LIEKGLRLIVTDNWKAMKSKRVMPRVSKATGGAMPRINLAAVSALQEMDDLDYVERMKRFR